MKRGEFFQKNVSRPSNPPDELAQNVSKKIPFRRIIPPFFLQKCRIWPFFIYLHDSNSIFWARGIKSEGFLGRTVWTCAHGPRSRSATRQFGVADFWELFPNEARGAGCSAAFVPVSRFRFVTVSCVSCSTVWASNLCLLFHSLRSVSSW